MENKLYRDFQDWRVKLYQAIANRQCSDAMLQTLAGDLRQTLERIENATQQADPEKREQ